MRWVLALLLLVAGCGSSAPNAIAGAVIGTAIGMTASAISRAEGGCYASCPPGTACEESTGLCRPLPCRGTCKRDEVCEQVGDEARCVKSSPIPSAVGIKDDLRDPSKSPYLDPNYPWPSLP